MSVFFARQISSIVKRGKNSFDIFENVRHTSIRVDPFEASEFFEVFDDRHRISVMADKSSFQDFEIVALSSAPQTPLDASVFVAVQEENEFGLK